MQLYRFSPIANQAALLEAATYVAAECSRLSMQVVGDRLPIASLTVFAHYESEFEMLASVLPVLGDPYNENNGPRITLRDPLRVGADTITQLRVRKPDPYRMQVGCCDFEVSDFAAFKAVHLEGSADLRLIERPDYEMVEFFHPDFDVLGYVVAKP